MNLSNLYRTLSSVWLAIALIALCALEVIAGTVIEGLTGSHERAALYTYGHPLFKALLVGFFLNILLSALRRLPWKWCHTSFLLAHLGLLMVITGVFVKITFGLQGHMVIMEGAETNQVWLPGTETIDANGRELDCEIVAYSPHAEEKLERWFKNDLVYVDGLKPIAMGEIRAISMEGSLITVTAADAPRDGMLTFVRSEDAVYVGTEKLPQAHVAIDGGRGGYGVVAQIDDFTLFTPLTRQITPLPSLAKLEDNRPLVTVRYQGETVPLLYDATGSGLRWPIGDKLVRFQPKRTTLPYHVRLRQVRQINHPGTEKPAAYEADIVVDGRPRFLAMNRVVSLPGGYRLYLSNLNNNRAQIVVNRDPAKYLLTYPGCLLISLGTLMLYIKKRP